MWGNGWGQRLRLAPLYLAVITADRLGRIPHRRKPRAMPRWRDGLSIIIPDRDAPDMLGQAVKSLLRALEPVREPWQIIVVANGAPIERYLRFRAAYPQIEFIHSEEA